MNTLIDRRTALSIIASYWLSYRVADAGSESPHPKSQDASSRGKGFLKGLFDPTLDLLPEFKGAKVYWLYHDNYLAAKALAGTAPDLAKRILAAIRSYGVKGSGKIEILFGEAKKPLPFRHYRLVDVKQAGDKLIKTEITSEDVLKGWEEYADLLFLAAIALAKSDPRQARQYFEQGLKLWDGRGFKDRVAKKSGKYTVYKIALALLAADKLKVQSDAKLVERLLKQQGEDGGWVTDYDDMSKPLGMANVETTSLAILALDALGQ